MKHPILAAAVAASAVAALAACSSQPNTTPDDSTSFPVAGTPVTLVVPFDAGGLTDTLARLVAPAFEDALGTTVRVENKPGAGGQIGLTELVGEDPDGYTIGFTNLPSGLAYLDPARAATYDFDSFSPIASVALSPTVLAVRADSPYETLQDYVDAAKDTPGVVTLGSGGSGASDDYLASVYLEDEADVDLNIVTFEGGSSDKVTALLGGSVEAIMGSAGGFLPQVESGQLRLLASATTEPSAILDDVPTFGEEGYDVVSSGTINISGPAGIPDEVIEALSAAIKVATEDPQFTDKLAASGFETHYQSSADLIADWKAQETLVRETVFSD
ncbi:MAG: tripartite tricarboxylate transporter substrate binding protein [Protaetiibacter sp.]